MLPQSFRLDRQHFLKVKTSGRTFNHSHFFLTYLPNTLGYCRLAVVTSSILSKRAVIRNRLRRRIYSSLLPTSLGTSMDIILTPKSPLLQLSSADLGSLLNPILSGITFV